MEMKIENANNIMANLKVLKGKRVEKKISVKDTSRRLIAKMNLAYNNPSEKIIKEIKETRAMAKEINLANEYAKMEQAYASFEGFGELL